MKVAIITIIDKENIGNRLQNYAVQELLKYYGLDVTTINYYNSNNNMSVIDRIKQNVFCIVLKSGFFQSDFYIFKLKHNPKLKLIRDFNEKYIRISNKYIFKSKKKSRIKKCANDFDYYCIGSDQIWNSFLVQNNDFFFGCFAKPEQCFSFSASMGTAYVDEKYVDTYKRGLKHLGNISVREIETYELINKLVGRETTVLLDPTLILPKDKWLDIAQKPNIRLSNRIFITYFLSEPTNAQTNLIKEFARKHKAEIIEINGVHKEFIGPAEFVYLFSRSEYVFTDSFHGTAFAIIFNKPFISFYRNNMYDMSARITTLLKKLNLSDRFYKGNNNYLDINCNLYYYFPIDNVDEYLKIEREKATAFLGDCLRTGMDSVKTTPSQQC